MGRIVTSDKSRTPRIRTTEQTSNKMTKPRADIEKAGLEQQRRDPQATGDEAPAGVPRKAHRPAIRLNYLIL
jgi:hypothetical protein